MTTARERARQEILDLEDAEALKALQKAIAELEAEKTNLETT